MIVAAVILALIVLIALIPIRIEAEYRGSVSVVLRLPFFTKRLFPKERPKAEEQNPPRMAEASPVPSLAAGGTGSAASVPAPKREPTAEITREAKPAANKEPKKKARPAKKNKNNEAKNAAPPTSEEKAESLAEKLARYLDLAAEFLGPLRKAVRRLIKAESIRAHVTVGAGEADKTAETAGLLWGVGYGLIGLVNRLFLVESHDLRIVPEYRRRAFGAEADCILRTNIANIICAAAILGIAFVRYKLKHGRKKK